jgi:hypothetical protein
MVTNVTVGQELGRGRADEKTLVPVAHGKIEKIHNDILQQYSDYIFGDEEDIDVNPNESLYFITPPYIYASGGVIETEEPWNAMSFPVALGVTSVMRKR